MYFLLSHREAPTAKISFATVICERREQLWVIEGPSRVIRAAGMICCNGLVSHCTGRNGVASSHLLGLGCVRPPDFARLRREGILQHPFEGTHLQSIAISQGNNEDASHDVTSASSQVGPGLLTKSPTGCNLPPSRPSHHEWIQPGCKLQQLAYDSFGRQGSVARGDG